MDGAEVGQPAGFQWRKNAQEMREFYRRSGAAAIGSSDWHGMGPVGLCRTYVFAKDDSVAAILDAIRARRTVVLDRGLVFGDPVLAQLAGSQLGRELPARGLAAVGQRGVRRDGAGGTGDLQFSTGTFSTWSTTSTS